jgi:nitrate/nitrite transport system substrate-binding protein
MVSGAPDYAGIAAKVARTDLYEAAMKEIGFSHAGKDDKPETFFDGKAFDPANPEAYAASFDVKNLKG